MTDHEIVRYYDEIYRFCCHYTEDPVEAEDLCQETFISFLESSGPRSLLRSTKSHLYAIARNKCIDLYRRKRPIPLEELAESADEQGEAALRSVELRELLGHLEQEQRDALILRYFQDLKYREIAAVMDITVSKAKYLVGRALDILHEEVEQ